MGRTCHPAQGAGEGCRSAARERRRGRPAALDARGSYVRRTAPPRWLWPALAPHTGQGVAEGGARRQDDGWRQLPQLLAPCGSTPVSPDGWGAYERHRDAAQQQVGKEPTQKIESTPIAVRPRSKRRMRRTRCFATTECLQDLVMGLGVHRYEFGRPISTMINTFATPSLRILDNLRFLTYYTYAKKPPESGSCSWQLPCSIHGNC